MSVLAAFLEIVFFFTFSGLGDYAMTQLFPIHSIAVLSEFSVFQRIDVILTGVWILSAFIKISFMLYLSSYIACRSFSAKYKNIYICFRSGCRNIAVCCFKKCYRLFDFDKQRYKERTVLCCCDIYSAFDVRSREI